MGTIVRLKPHGAFRRAQKMGIDANNARVTLHHARQRLGRILGWSADEVSRVIQLCQVQAAEGRRTVPAA